MKLKFMILFSVFFGLISCTETVSKNDTSRILTIGDSMLAAHRSSGRAVSNAVERQIGQPIIDRSVLGARMIYRLPISGSAGLNIEKQYVAGDWDWVIVNGGGNDLWLGCGCLACNRKLDKLASKDGKSGKIPTLVQKIRATGAKVIFVGYLRSPGVGSPIEHCRDDGDELERRIVTHAQLDDGVTFVSLADLVPHGDRSFHGGDMIHPSVHGSAAIAARIAAVIKR